MQLSSIHSRSRVHCSRPECRLVTGSKSPTNILSSGRTSTSFFLSGREEHPIQRFKAEGLPHLHLLRLPFPRPSIPLMSSPSSSLSCSIDASGSSSIGVLGGFLSSSASPS
eukprot:g27334.t1